MVGFVLIWGHIVEWLEGDIDLSADDAAALSRGESASSDNGQEHDRTAQWIRDLLTGVKLPADEVVKRGKNELLVSKSTLHRAFKRCGGKPRKDGDGPWMWGLPDVDQVIAKVVNNDKSTDSA